MNELEMMLNDLKSEMQEKLNACINNYETAKNNLVIRPINIDNVKPNSVYHLIGSDLALTLYLVLKDDTEKGLLHTVQVPTEMIKDWNVETETVFQAALKNTADLQRPLCYENIFDMSKSKSAYDFHSTENILMITTSRKTNGAIAMFLPYVLENIARGINNSFYAVFTSIHECMIHPANGNITVSGMIRNLQETNRIFGPDDTLTNSVFFYDRDRKTFEPVSA